MASQEIGAFIDLGLPVMTRFLRKIQLQRWDPVLSGAGGVFNGAFCNCDEGAKKESKVTVMTNGGRLHLGCSSVGVSSRKGDLKPRVQMRIGRNHIY